MCRVYYHVVDTSLFLHRRIKKEKRKKKSLAFQSNFYKKIHENNSAVICLEGRINLDLLTCENVTIPLPE